MRAGVLGIYQLSCAVSILEAGSLLSLRGQVQIRLIGRWLSRAFHPGYERWHRSEQGPGERLGCFLEL